MIVHVLKKRKEYCDALQGWEGKNDEEIKCLIVS